MRTRRSFLNFGTALMFTVVTTATALVTAPHLLEWLGQTRYGLVKTLVEWLNYLMLLEFGLSGALSPLLARAYGAGDAAAVRKTLAVGMRAYFRVSALVIVAGVALAASITHLIRVPPGLEWEVRVACLVHLASMGTLVLIPFRAALEARQKTYLVNLLLTAQAVVIAGASLLLASRGFGVVGQVMAVVIGVSLFYLVITINGLRRNPGLVREVVSGPVDSPAWQALRTLGWSTFVIQLCGRISLMSDKIVVGGLLGPEDVARLHFTQQLAVLSQSLLLNLGTATWAALAELHARGAHETFRRRLIELTGMVAVLGVAGLGAVFAYNHQFLRAWLGPENAAANDAGTAVVGVAAINALFLALTSLWGWTFVATGQVARLSRAAMGGASVNLVASLLFTWQFGLIGPLLGTLTSLTTVSLWYLPRLLRSIFGVDPRELALAVLRPIALGIPYTAGLIWLARTCPPSPRLFDVVGTMGLAAAGFVGLCGLIVLSPAERSAWRARLRAFWPARASTPVA